MLLSGIAGQKTVRQLLEDERRSLIPMLDETKAPMAIGVYVLDARQAGEPGAGLRDAPMLEQRAGQPWNGVSSKSTCFPATWQKLSRFRGASPRKGERNGAGKGHKPLGCRGSDYEPIRNTIPLVTRRRSPPKQVKQSC